jgi:non-heme chloroperoxidase
MKRLLAWLALTLFQLIPSAQALDIAGTWQTDESRYVMKITGSAKTGWRGEWFNLGDVDGTLNGNPLSVTFKDRNITISPIRSPGTFTGAVSQDGVTISGSWAQDAGEPLTLHRIPAQDAHPIDPSPHKVRFVTVAPSVKLEVLDWGGNGPPLVFLAGLGHTGHNFDSFALKFTDKHHVYAITRRGYGVSSEPPPTDDNYGSDRLADDVLAVLDALHIEKPVLAGHSISGQELSSIGTRHPERVAGLVYLDAAYGYAFYDPAGLMAGYVIEAIVRRDLDQLRTAPPSRARVLVTEVQAALPALEREMTSTAASLKDRTDPPTQEQKQRYLVDRAIINNAHPYSAIKAPMLVLAADPPRCAPSCDTQSAKTMAAAVHQQVAFVEAQFPGARVVRLPHAIHFIWRSNDAQVEQEMNAFMDGLPK